jgi:hypothetical protein
MISERFLEGDYQRALLARAAEWKHVRLFRRNVGLVKLDAQRVFRAGIPGQCDLYALARGGWHGEVELKRFGRLNEAQERWRDWCIDWGVSWILLEADRSEAPAVTVDRWVRELGAWLPGCSPPPSGPGLARCRT